ncbi:pirin family protein [Variovorax saccharolyticus]|uniref:pirin family protein n=1 Tax=Variovorax saccharolyticus TaxID=3053516 RepID=UPI0025784254|nr:MULTISPECIES: pirin family protein [unclassified Variovorax]MDM0022277.1 pirin family protein [Variovorax sp. J22R187]MDM0028833.1 pirin family protein [Variovorax sp. J31P216]
MTAATASTGRAIVHRTRGSRQGPITRLVSPGDLGELLKPFVFLDHFAFEADPGYKGFGMHPHSGIATLTYMAEGSVRYEDTTGEKGVLPEGGVEWMRAGNGVWHTGAPLGGSPVGGFQLWVALPAAEENAPAQSLYLAPSQVPQVGPVRVLLGSYGVATSHIPAPAPMNYLAVRLTDGQRWRYAPPAGHTVAWVAVNEGGLGVGDRSGGPVATGELAVFEESGVAIDVEAHGDTAFVLGSAAKHPHALVTGYYSVHTSPEALERGEAEIRRIGARLSPEQRAS